MNKANNGSLSKLADAAFQQAAAQVIKQAKQSGTPVIIWEGAGVKAVASETIQLVKKPRNTRKARKRRKRTKVSACFVGFVGFVGFVVDLSWIHSSVN